MGRWDLNTSVRTTIPGTITLRRRLLDFRDGWYTSKPGDTASCYGGKAVRVHVVMVCAAVASVIILAYFWRSHGERPFLYA